ncbi:Polynucleotide 5'-hydroxyl-kinase nol9 [Homalodisca vitripennis]|nr:Polynucleotide 5'-hydroxyl-kinase nol9 [Homalodisca vitripennis]
MSEYTDMILIYGKVNKNGLAAVQEYRDTFPHRRTPDRKTFEAVERRLRETGSFKPKRIDTGRQRSARNYNNEQAIINAVELSPTTSTRRLSLPCATLTTSIYSLRFKATSFSKSSLHSFKCFAIRINMDQINLKITNKYNFTKAQLCATMNGNLVALCIMNEGDKFPHCPGFGIVRGIDYHTSTIYLITPMPRDVLKQINCIVKGNICLPESLHFSQVNEAVGPIPFLAHTSGKPTSRFAKRDFRKLPVS